LIRVATVIEALGRGGAERLLVDIARLLDRRRFSLRVYTLFPVRRDYAEALRALEVPEECLDLRGPREILAGVRRLRDRLRRDGADVVHTHLFAANVVGRLAARGERLPVLSTYHDADYEPVVRAGNPGLTPAKQSLLRLVDGLTVAWSRARIVGVSEYVAISMRRRLLIPERRVTVVTNAVDTDVFTPDEGKRAATRAGLGLHPGQTVVACVGRMTPQKGQDLLLRAFAEAHREVPESRLLFVGEGAQRAQYEELTRTLELTEAVRFLGLRSDVPDLLRASDLLALPSRHEGFGLVLAEALACEVPVVATNSGPMPEIVREGQTGHLFPEGDVPALAKALADLLRDPARRREMGKRGREDVILRFALPDMVRKLEALYTDAVTR